MRSFLTDVLASKNDCAWPLVAKPVASVLEGDHGGKQKEEGDIRIGARTLPKWYKMVLPP